MTDRPTSSCDADVIVLGTGAAGSGRRAGRRRRRCLRRAVREGRPSSAGRPPCPAAPAGCRTTRTWRAAGDRRQPRRRPGLPRLALARPDRSGAGGRLRRHRARGRGAGSRRDTRCGSGWSRLPRLPPRAPGREARRRAIARPWPVRFDELGPWAERVVRPARNGQPHPRRDPDRRRRRRRSIPRSSASERRRDVRGCGQALVGALLQGVPRPRHRAGDRRPSGRSGRRRRPGRRCRASRGRTGRSSHGRTAGSCSPPAASSGTPTLVQTFLRGPMDSPASVPTNTGDGLRMAMRVGAALGKMSEAWWVPTIEIPGDELFGRQRAHLILRERTLPRSIMVNRPAAASRTRRRTTTPSAVRSTSSTPPGSSTPTCRAGWSSITSTCAGTGSPARRPVTVPDCVTSASTRRRARRADRRRCRRPRPPPSSAGTTLVADGHDDDFGRGDSAYDSWNGDPQLRPGRRRDARAASTSRRSTPSRSTAARSAPRAGPAPTVDGQVLGTDGQPIAGLVRSRQRHGRRHRDGLPAAPAARSVRRSCSATAPVGTRHTYPFQSPSPSSSSSNRSSSGSGMYN